jgi:hypothetical protein
MKDDLEVTGLGVNIMHGIAFLDELVISGDRFWMAARGTKRTLEHNRNKVHYPSV